MALSSEAPSGVLLASAARTADAYSEAHTNDAGFRGLILSIVTSSEVGTCTALPTIQAWDAAASAWRSAIVGAQIAAAATTVIAIYPAAASADGAYTAELDTALPIVWRFFWDQETADGSTGFTVSVGYNYIA